MNEQLTLEEATAFFAQLFYGEHNIPHGGVKAYGQGWYVKHLGGLATYDSNQLTRLVLIAHQRCCRAEIVPSHFKELKICIWKRHRKGWISARHPTIREALWDFEMRES